MRLETFDQEMMAKVVSHLQDNTLTKLHVTEFIPGDTLSDSTIRFIRRNISTLRKLVIERLTILDVEGLQYPQLTGLKKLELTTAGGDLNTLLKVSPNLEELYLENCLVYATQCYAFCQEVDHQQLWFWSYNQVGVIFKKLYKFGGPKSKRVETDDRK